MFQTSIVIRARIALKLGGIPIEGALHRRFHSIPLIVCIINVLMSEVLNYPVEVHINEN